NSDEMSKNICASENYVTSELVNYTLCLSKILNFISANSESVLKPSDLEVKESNRKVRMLISNIKRYKLITDNNKFKQLFDLQAKLVSESKSVNKTIKNNKKINKYMIKKANINNDKKRVNNSLINIDIK